MYNKILVAVDGSPHSVKAAHHSIELAGRFPESELTLLHVMGISEAADGELNNEILDEQMIIMKPILDSAKKKGVACELIFLHGEPGPVIVEHANGNDYNLILLGSRGLGSLKELVLGSVSHRVAKQALCPVMIIK